MYVDGRLRKYLNSVSKIVALFIMRNPQLLFTTKAYQFLIPSLSNKNLIPGQLLATLFPDGEVYHRIETEVYQQDVVLIGGTIDDANTLELFDLAVGISQLGAHSLTIIIPYFGYATMERAVKKGEIVKAKNRALLFSSIPACAEPTRIFLLDLHAEGIPYYFEQRIRCKHIYAKSLILSVIQQIANPDTVLAATDAGRAKWVESLANDLHMDSAFVYKQRIGGAETRITGVNAIVKGKQVIIYDDMIRTGGSLMQAARAYHDAGAVEIIAITTHGLFTNDALSKIQTQGIISKVFATNSHPAAISSPHSLLTVLSIDELLKNLLD